MFPTSKPIYGRGRAYKCLQEKKSFLYKRETVTHKVTAVCALRRRDQASANDLVSTGDRVSTDDLVSTRDRVLARECTSDRDQVKDLMLERDRVRDLVLAETN